ncbi:MAG: hypothetical protein Fur0015_07200 [Ignavibacteriales bacterium]
MKRTRVKVAKVYISTMIYEYEFEASGMDGLDQEDLFKEIDNNNFRYCTAYYEDDQYTKLIHQYIVEIKEYEDWSKPNIDSEE